jgi:hypothetical protein
MYKDLPLGSPISRLALSVSAPTVFRVTFLEEPPRADREIGDPRGDYLTVWPGDSTIALSMEFEDPVACCG